MLNTYQTSGTSPGKWAERKGNTMNRAVRCHNKKNTSQFHSHNSKRIKLANIYAEVIKHPDGFAIAVDFESARINLGAIFEKIPAKNVSLVEGHNVCLTILSGLREHLDYQIEVLNSVYCKVEARQTEVIFDEIMDINFGQ